MNSLNLLVVIIACISLFVVSIPIIYSLILPIVKPTIKKQTSRYLYAFTSGFFMIMATVLFISESKHEMDEYFSTFISNQVLVQFVVGVIIAVVVLIGLSSCLLIKYLFAKKNTTEFDEHHHHSHSHDHMIFNINDYNPKSKALAIFFMLSHRIPDGLIIGILASQIAQANGSINVAQIVFLVSFVIHIIPEELVIYYRQIEIGIPKWKATRNSLIAVGMIVPLIIIGSIVGWFAVENIGIQIIQLLAASFLIFTAIIEFFPEFLHDNIKGKSWYITMLMFIIGISVALFVLSFHTHAHA